MKPSSTKLSGRRIAVLAADGFEMAEVTVPVNALRLACAAITVVSLRKGRIRGVNLHEPAHRIGVDLTVDKASEANFDALFIPGGFINPDLLRQSEAARAFVRSFNDAGKPIASLCHGPWLLASSGVLEGRVVSAWPGIRDDMVNAGATWIDEPVARDGNLLTSRGPQDFAQFVPALVGFFAEDRSSMESRAANPQATSSPMRSNPPSLVLNTMRWMPRPSFRGFALGLLAAGVLMRLGRKGRPAGRNMRRNIDRVKPKEREESMIARAS